MRVSIPLLAAAEPECRFHRAVSSVCRVSTEGSLRFVTERARLFPHTQHGRNKPDSPLSETREKELAKRFLSLSLRRLLERVWGVENNASRPLTPKRVSAPTARGGASLCALSPQKNAGVSSREQRLERVVLWQRPWVEFPVGFWNSLWDLSTVSVPHNLRTSLEEGSLCVPVTGGAAPRATTLTTYDKERASDV